MRDFKRMLPVYLLTLVNVLSFSLLIPVFPFLIREYNESEVMLGVLMALFSAFQFIGSPVMGSLSDRFGRKPILLITQLGTLLSWIVFGAAYFVPVQDVFGLMTLPVLIICFSRIVDGITGGNISVTNAYLADITSRDERSVFFGYIGAIFGIGMIIGPALGAFAMSTGYGFLGTAAVGALISAVTLICMILWLRESLPRSKRDEQFDANILRQINIWRKFKKYLPVRLITTALGFRLIMGIILGGYTTVITLYIIDRFRLGESQVGFFMLFVGGFMIFNQMVMVKRFVSRFGDLKTLVIGQFLMAAGLFAMPLMPSVPLFIAAYYVNNLGLSVSFPTLQSILTKNANEKQQGEVLGLSESMGSFAMVIAPLISSSLYVFLAGQTFWIFSFTALAGVAWFLLSYRGCRAETVEIDEKGRG